MGCRMRGCWRGCCIDGLVRNFAANTNVKNNANVYEFRLDQRPPGDRAMRMRFWGGSSARTEKFVRRGGRGIFCQSQ